MRQLFLILLVKSDSDMHGHGDNLDMFNLQGLVVLVIFRVSPFDVQKTAKDFWQGCLCL